MILLRIALWPLLFIALFAIGMILVVRFATLLVIDLIETA